MPSGKMCTQLKRLLGYAEGVGNESMPLVVYVSSDAENGSVDGKLAGSCSLGTGDEVCWKVDEWP